MKSRSSNHRTTQDVCMGFCRPECGLTRCERFLVQHLLVGKKIFNNRHVWTDLQSIDIQELGSLEIPCEEEITVFTGQDRGVL